MENIELEEMVVDGADEVIEDSEDTEIEAEPSNEEVPEEEEDVISIEGETPPIQEEHRAPDWVRDLRKRNKAQNEEINRLKADLERVGKAPVVDLPAKPKLEDFDYDTEEFEKALDTWHVKRDEVNRIKAQQEKALEAQQQEWKATIDNYVGAKEKLRVKDYDIAEGIVEDTLSAEQQAVILKGASNPATVVYALGKNKDKLDALAGIKDPIKFAFAVAELQSKLKVERRNAPPEPERKIKGSANGSGVDSTLESLRKEAERTGNYSKVIAYKNTQKGN